MRHIGDELAEIVKPLDPVAIPTKYQGVEFRSRLEARWAVFLDAIRVRWLYEFEGFQLPSGWYLPDFWAPDLKVWLEIKPFAPSPEEAALCAELARASGKRVLLAFGAPSYDGDEDSIRCFYPGGDESNFYRFCECPECGAVGVEFEGRGSRVCGYRCTDMDRGHTGDADRFMEAYRTAQLARFWDPR